ncbi:hypothetical protein [Thiomicrospira sp.]|jgi:hypothetical protein|uniref:hypothetical protein n=1 Tax=Thiomicrospira sp. TaxID=935 RepID=UPI002F9217E8
MLSITELTQRVKATPVSLSHCERIALLQDAHILDSDERLNRFFQVKDADIRSLGGDKAKSKLTRSSYSEHKSN